MFEYRLSVRGYELDSYNHVNNAVYLNYYEQARWQLMKETGLLEKLQNEKILVVVTEINIRYSKEARLFDNILIKSKVEFSGPYIVFKQYMFNEDDNIQISHTTVKTIPLNQDRVPCGLAKEYEVLLTKNN
ncbi:MAG TPA: acyl-CoA thioesterase [Bacteroidales bacterium]|nr:acyl-CoA thioesterase [Bacteroidales bacterium]HPB25570.1 acyl-CoA thioesterase [Bacteroidales bacterium]HPI30404.1 acyl-CoA thioesterase [Bacteroidales bacterium]HQN16632.1 acyl-CoA thioesterase [Bacteroidales bacterium]HQP16221.1 acyl-CoA thioesterase [Bacteroidales bacterium]